MRRSQRLVAEREGTVGAASIGRAGREEDNEKSRSCSASGSRPAERGSGVATQLVQAGADAARASRAAATSPTGWGWTTAARSPSPAASASAPRTAADRCGCKSDDDGEDEIAMVLPLGDDRVDARLARSVADRRRTGPYGRRRASGPRGEAVEQLGRAADDEGVVGRHLGLGHGVREVLPGALTPTTVTPYLLRIALCPRVNPMVSCGGVILTIANPSSNSM